MKIIRLRKSAGLTQGELAARCETTQQQIAKIETGIVDPRLSTLRKVAAALNCELPDLFYSRSEFLSALNEVISKSGIDLQKAKVSDLNLASLEYGVPPFHPFWEVVYIDKSKKRILLREVNP